MRIDELLWDGENERHIARHGVSPDEVEEACFGRHYARRSGKGRYLLLGQTEAGRYLRVVLERKMGYKFRPITAYDMSEANCKLYRREVQS